jgi:hypothetical protein
LNSHDRMIKAVSQPLLPRKLSEILQAHVPAGSGKSR